VERYRRCEAPWYGASADLALGLHEPRRVLRETLEWPTKYAQIFANCPLRLRSGSVSCLFVWVF